MWLEVRDQLGMALRSHSSQVSQLKPTPVTPGVKVRHLLPLWLFSVFSHKSYISSSHSVVVLSSFFSFSFLCFLDRLLHLLLFVAVREEYITKSHLKDSFCS